MKTTYAWVAKPNSGNYTKTRIGSHQTRRDFFALYAGITTKERVEDRFTKYEFPNGNIYKSDIDVVSTEKFEDLGDLEAKFQEQLYINATRDAADYLKKKGIDAKFFNRSESVRHYGYYLHSGKKVGVQRRYEFPFDELSFMTPSGNRQRYDPHGWRSATFFHRDEKFKAEWIGLIYPEKEDELLGEAVEYHKERVKQGLPKWDQRARGVIDRLPRRRVSLEEFSQNLSLSGYDREGDSRSDNAITCVYLDLNKKLHKEALSIFLDYFDLELDLDCDGENAGHLYMASGFFNSDLYRFLEYCRDKNNDSLRDEKVYEKLIKDVCAYHNQNYSDENMKQPEQNSYDAQVREAYEQATEAIINTDRALNAGQQAVEATKQACELIDKLQKENKKLKEEKDQMEHEYLLAIGKLMKRLYKSDVEELKKFIENNTETAASGFATLVRLEKKQK